MAKCPTCNIEILDETEYCPLCKSILEQTDPLENMYPDVRPKMQRLNLAVRIYLLCAILVQAALFSINLVTDSQIWWSAISGLGLLYVYLILRYAIWGKSGHRGKVIVLGALAICVAILVDFTIGYSGWSLDYVLPSGIVLVDIALVICMICNHRNWQSYIMWQLLMLLCSLVPMFLYFAKLEHNPYLAFSPLIVSAAIFLGTMIIGDRRAYMELYRRFHI